MNNQSRINAKHRILLADMLKNRVLPVFWWLSTTLSKKTREVVELSNSLSDLILSSSSNPTSSLASTYGSMFDHRRSMTSLAELGARLVYKSGGNWFARYSDQTPDLPNQATPLHPINFHNTGRTVLRVHRPSLLLHRARNADNVLHGILPTILQYCRSNFTYILSGYFDSDCVINVSTDIPWDEFKSTFLQRLADPTVNQYLESGDADLLADLLHLNKVPQVLHCRDECYRGSGMHMNPVN